MAFARDRFTNDLSSAILGPNVLSAWTLAACPRQCVWMTRVARVCLWSKNARRALAPRAMAWHLITVRRSVWKRLEASSIRRLASHAPRNTEAAHRAAKKSQRAAHARKLV